MALSFFQNSDRRLASWIDTAVIVINVVIGGFSEESLKWLPHVIVRLGVSDYSHLSDYNFADK